jgi:ketosteroid isomerase-like protein
MATYHTRRAEEVDYLLARAFSERDVEACAALYHPDASVVRLGYFGWH